MSDQLGSLISSLSEEKRAVLARLLTPRPDPIAVIGMACRFPGGAHSPEAFWDVMKDEVDAVTEVPSDRWNVDRYYDPDPSAPGKTNTRAGAFLSQVDEFDAQFFGLSPREVVRMDPQHRLLLETTWEALEDGGQPQERLAGSETGIFAGITMFDYFVKQVAEGVEIDGHSGMGFVHCTATGRVSHLLDLRGPSIAVDTACSSSLVAVHLACQSLRNKECSLALAGGVNVMVSPISSVCLAKWGVLAPDGRCKPFDAAADGFGRGEGCGMVVLKRLPDAIKDGDRILAVVRGSAINQDGHSTRLSAPNGLAQQAVIRKALDAAGIAPSELSFIEAHGTGTQLGDPIEVDALTTVVGQPRTGGKSCVLGSVKANVGHLESAAGIAGFIKTVLCLQHQAVPPQLHLHTLNPGISLENTPFVIAKDLTPWTSDAGPRYAGVSSFGLSGTNAHVILEESPGSSARETPMAPEAGRAYLLPVSARSQPALQSLVRAYDEHLTHEVAQGTVVADVCYTASLRRSHHPYRTAVVGHNRDELAEQLKGEAIQEARTAVYASTAPRVAFVFSGQGSQWAGMGRQLLSDESVFRETMGLCDALFRRYADWSLLDLLSEAEETSRLHDTEIAQPAIFAIQVSLVSLYRSWGIVPDAAVGHSVGEIAAAHTAGALSFEDATRVVFHRARIMQGATGNGRMAAVALSQEASEQAIAEYAGRLSIAAINGPSSTVLTGETAALQELMESLRQQQVFCRDLGVAYAFHSPQMEPFSAELASALEGLEPSVPSLPIVSTVTGDVAGKDAFNHAHWAKGIRDPVRFADSILRLVDDDYGVFLEVGPHPSLATPLSQCLGVRNYPARILASLRRGQEERTSLLRSVGALYASGCEVDWSAFYPNGGTCVELPRYPWQRKRYWIEPTGPQPAIPARPEAGRRAGAAQTTHSEAGNELVSDYYDRVSNLPEQQREDSFLTFAPFSEPVVGFSWLLTCHDVLAKPDHLQLVEAAQKQLRRVLFRGIDFAAIDSVLDFGCGYGSDLLALAKRHDHMRLDGYTISERQAAIGNQKILKSEVQDCVSIFHRNSALDEFPGQYDLVFGFEVAHYVQDKDLLFANIERHLRDGAFVVLADFVANTVSEIGHAETSSFIITLNQWADLLSRYKLRVVECVDVSREMANFLHDPDAEANLARLAAHVDDDGPIRSHFASYSGLGRLFEKQLATYALLTIQKDRYLTKEEVARINREKIGTPTPYADVLCRGGIAEGDAGDPTPARLDWLYGVRWKETARVARSSSAGACASGTWVILSDDGGVGSALADRLETRGADCIVVRRSNAYQSSNSNEYRVNPSCPDDVMQLFRDVSAPDGEGLYGVIHLWGLDSTSLEGEDQTFGCGSLLHTVQAVSETQTGKAQPSRVWVATRGGQPVGEDSVMAVAQAGLWGLGRTVATEQPSLWGGLMDLDPEGSDTEAAEQLLDQVLDPDGEDQVGWRDGKRFVARLVPQRDGLDKPRVAQLAPDGCYLITGGLGDLGLEVARWMAERGAGHLALLQRGVTSDLSADTRDADDGTSVRRRAEALREIEARGSRVHLISADVGQKDQVAKALTDIRDSIAPLRGIVHAAGTVNDGVLEQLTEEHFVEVMAPKIAGGWWLHTLTTEDPLDFFVSFSSVASLLGSPGQANYAAANAGLDALVHLRKAEGRPALSINWGPWADVGMAAAQTNRGARVAQHGIGSIDPARGILVMEHVMQRDLVQVAVIPLALDQLRASWSALTSPFLAELEPSSSEPESTPVAPETEMLSSDPDLRQAILAAEDSAKRGLLERYITEQTSRVLHLSPGEVDLQRPFNSLGIDSLMAVELRNRIETDLAVRVDLVTFLEGATGANLVAMALAQLLAVQAGPSPAQMERALEKLDQLSDEEVRALLAAKKRSSGESQ